jgi:hypothetical protein
VAAILIALRSFVLSVVLFPVAAAAHEVGHLVVLSWFGHPAQLVVHSYRFRFFDLTAFGVHAAPSAAPAAGVRVLNDFLGPLLVAALLFILWLAGRATALGPPLMANVLCLVFLSALEGAYAVGEYVAGVDMDGLTVAELNYGACLVIIALVSLFYRPSGARAALA